MTIILLAHRWWLLSFVAAWLLLAASGCAQAPSMASAAVPPIPPGEARVWFYREFIPSESLNMTEVRMNGAYARLFAAGRRLLPRRPGPASITITVASWGVDVEPIRRCRPCRGPGGIHQESNRCAAGRSCGERNGAARDTFYARLIPPQIARAEITQSTYDGGS